MTGGLGWKTVGWDQPPTHQNRSEASGPDLLPDGALRDGLQSSVGEVQLDLIIIGWNIIMIIILMIN